MNFIQSNVTILFSGIIFIGCLFGFLLFRKAVGGKFLDFTFTFRQANGLLGELSHEQAKNHLLVTTILDSVFPISYGLLFVGLALRKNPLHPFMSLMPAFLAVLFDFCENTTNIIALKTRKVPRLKPYFTVLKFIFFLTAVGLTILLFGEN